MTVDRASSSRPHPLGVRPRDGGVEVAVLAAHAEGVWFCLPADGGERQVELTARTHDVWHAFVPDVPVGSRYGYRVSGRWEPVLGHRHNPAKFLLDPYARALDGPLLLRPEAFAHTVDERFAGDPAQRDGRDSVGVVPHGVVTGRPFDWGGDAPPRVPTADTVVYEAHVKGFTRRMPGVPEHLRGTYAGLASDAAIEHLVRLGVTTVELLPIHAIGDEPSLVARGMPNYWGYSTLSFFAPEPRYAAASDPLDVLDEVKGMVRRLHEAGLEVVLDVVYNHTCEGGPGGPSLSWRGLDAATYYRLDPHGGYVDTTGCGNSLDAREPRVLQLVLDSLRYWVEEVHVDGFRFDLAPTLARGHDGFDGGHPFLVAARIDPVLGGVKLIAEPWDLGSYGWRTGQFPTPWSEWNDRFRDGVRDFWLGGGRQVARGEQGGGVRDLATRLAGSADVFPPQRGPLASVNFVTAHDGFTLADLTAYDGKHNEANGENNRDGTDDNHSWNHGVEGPTADADILAARRRTARNLLGTLLLATGIPMITQGDEFGRTQHGNNNAYCLDDETSWVDWDLRPDQLDRLETTAHLLRLRREHPVLRQDRFFAGRPVHLDGTKDLAWFGPDGTEMNHERWHDPSLRTLQMYLHAVVPDGEGRHVDESLLVVVQGAGWPVAVQLPGEPWASRYRLLWDSAFELPPGTDRGPAETVEAGGAVVLVDAGTIRVYGASGVPA
ncbi:MAG TPA: glycogen debranching protein GlgX [Kineosporiaceae bacterium]|nr:glycogen debranching protein GlgX [Kineosporiaceae bacterium]